MHFTQVPPFLIFDITTPYEIPTKPFGIPYRIAVIDKNKGQGIVGDTFDSIIELWSTGFSSKPVEEQHTTLLELGKAVITQLQANELKREGVNHLSNDDKMTILSVSSEIVSHDIEWEHDTKLYALGSGMSNNDPYDSVKYIDVNNSFSLINSLESLGLVSVFAGESAENRLAIQGA